MTDHPPSSQICRVARRGVRAALLVIVTAAGLSAQLAPPDPAAATNAHPGAAIRTEPRVAWEVKPRYRDSSAFALGNGVLVAGNTSGQGGTFGYDVATGRQLWSVPGHIRGGPVVHGGFAYAVNDTKDRYRFALRKLDLRTGRAAWSVAEEDLGNHDGPPVVMGDVVVVTSRSRAIAAYDLATGAERWKHANLQVCSGRLAAADGFVYLNGGLPGTTDTLTALDVSTGATVWKTLLTAGDNKGCGAGAAVADGVVVTGLGRDLLGFDAKSGERRWMRAGPPPVAGRRQEMALGFTAITRGVVYAASATTIVGTDVASGRPVFEFAMPVPSELGTIRLVAQGDVLFVVANEQLPGERGPAYLYALDLNDPRVLWRHHVARIGPYDKRGSWTTTSVQPADGSLFYENEQLLVKLAP